MRRAARKRVPQVWILRPGKARLFILLALGAALIASIAPAQSTGQKRPMTFEDMMQMKRLGETAVSPDGKWLAYSVTTVDLAREHQDAGAVAAGDCGRRTASKLAVAQPGDCGLQFAPDGQSDSLPFSGREGGQQVWLADFDPATGATSNAKKLTAISTEADNASGRRTGTPIVFTSAVYPDCPAITTADGGSGRQVQRRSRRGAGRQQGEGADFYAPALSALGPLHGRQEVPPLSGFGGWQAQCAT